MRVKHIESLIIRNMGGTAEYSSLLTDAPRFFVYLEEIRLRKKDKENAKVIRKCKTLHMCRIPRLSESGILLYLS